MNKAETALILFEKYNCAQAVFSAWADDFGLEKDIALGAALGFGGGMGRTQETCGALTGAIIVFGLASGFKENDSREKINEIYAQVRRLIDDFKAKNASVKCRDLLGCDLLSEDGQKIFKEQNLKDRCRAYVRFACELLEKYLAENGKIRETNA